MLRAAQHEAGHIVTAQHFNLPVCETVTASDGSGRTSYWRWLTSSDDVEVWCISAFAEALGERAMFLDGALPPSELAGPPVVHTTFRSRVVGIAAPPADFCDGDGVLRSHPFPVRF